MRRRLLLARGRRLRQSNGCGIRGKMTGGSQRIHSRRRRGRGRSGADESGDGDRRVRGGEKRRGGASGASGGAWLGEVGRGRSGGACGLVGESREARWPWWQWTAATSALGRERGRAEKGEGGRERVRERSEGAAWRHPKKPGRRGKQEVAGACTHVSGTRPPAYWQEVEDGGGCGGLGC